MDLALEGNLASGSGPLEKTSDPEEAHEHVEAVKK